MTEHDSVSLLSVRITVNDSYFYVSLDTQYSCHYIITHFSSGSNDKKNKNTLNKLSMNCFRLFIYR